MNIMRSARSRLFYYFPLLVLFTRQDHICLASSIDNGGGGKEEQNTAEADTIRQLEWTGDPKLDPEQIAKTDACGLQCIAPNVDPDDFAACLIRAFPFPQEGNPHPHQRQLFWPGSEGWEDALFRSFGPPKSPAAVVYAKTTDDVSEAVKCASANGYKVSARGRGHSFQGWGVIDGGLVIDMSNLCYPDEFIIDKSQMGPHILPGSKYIATIKAGAGCTNAVMLSAVHTKFQREERAMALIGGCPSVGIAGYTLGGGMGDITPYVGYAADLLVELEMVLYNGTVITASENEHEHPDLFWASRGGGGGNGIVTSLTYKVVQAPSDRFTQFVFKYNDSKVPFIRLQKYIYDTKSGSARFGGEILHADGISYVIGIYLGSWEEAAEDMTRFGLLDEDIFDKRGEPSHLFQNYTLICGEGEGEGKGDKQAPCYSANMLPPYGAEVSEYVSYAEMEGKVVCRIMNVFPSWTQRTSNVCEDLDLLPTETYCTTPIKTPTIFEHVVRAPGYDFDLNCENEEVIQKLLVKAADPQSFMQFSNTGKFNNSTLPFAGLLSPPLEDETIKNLVDGGDFHQFNFFHGAPFLVKPHATAFPWRNAGILTILIAQDKVDLLLKDRAFQNDPDRLQGYYNYMSPEIPNWRRFYFGENWERLTEVKGQYDPLNVFGKPITAEIPLESALKAARKKRKRKKPRQMSLFELFRGF